MAAPYRTVIENNPNQNGTLEKGRKIRRNSLIAHFLQRTVRGKYWLGLITLIPQSKKIFSIIKQLNHAFTLQQTDRDSWKTDIFKSELRHFYSELVTEDSFSLFLGLFKAFPQYMSLWLDVFLIANLSKPQWFSTFLHHSLHAGGKIFTPQTKTKQRQKSLAATLF